MADIFDVCDMVVRMVDGFEPEIIQCLGDNALIAEDAVRRQLISGKDGEDKYLTPTYDDDPYFEDEDSPWYHRSDDYKDWKKTIKPTVFGIKMELPPRPDNVPNLYINGKFYSDVFSTMQGDVLSIQVEEDGDGPSIVSKYGEQILQLSPTAIGYFNNTYIIPCIWKFFADCGYNPD
ncbi:MAG: hypothetical protein NC421_07550 [Lachnospiraceae bacterium]|nr:hypothetical protein [Lachnospiraceae bacterium]